MCEYTIHACVCILCMDAYIIDRYHIINHLFSCFYPSPPLTRTSAFGYRGSIRTKYRHRIDVNDDNDSNDVDDYSDGVDDNSDDIKRC